MASSAGPVVTWHSTARLTQRTIALAVVTILVASAITLYVSRQPFLGWPPSPILIDRSVMFDGGANGTDWALGMVYDNSRGVLYATGYMTEAGQGQNIWIAEYDQDLNQLRNTTIVGISQGDDAGYTLALDGSGMLYVTGYITELGEQKNIWIAKYDLNLTLQKSVSIDGASHQDDEGYGILCDEAGHLYVTGTITQPGQGYDIFIAEYDSDLNQLSNVTINGPSSMTDKGRFLAFGPDATLYVSGSMSQAGANYDIWLGRFSTNLVLLNQTIITGPTTGEDKGYQMVFDPVGNLYVVGTMTETDQGLNMWLAKFDAQLQILNSATFDGPAHGDDSLYSVLIGPEGDLWAAGVVSRNTTGSDIYIARYGTDLHLITDLVIDGPAHAFDTAFGITEGEFGHSYVSGVVTAGSTDQDAWLALVAMFLPSPS